MSDKLAIDGGEPAITKPLPAWPQWTEREQALLVDALDSGNWWAPAGSHVKAFERDFAAYQDAAYGVAVPNGSAALQVCLHAAGIDWGDEVITSSYTFVATAAACLMVGAVPVFVDVLPNTWNLDPDQIEAAITPRTKAIMPVHLGGEPADMDAVLDIAQCHGLLVIEDACQAHGAIWRGQKVGAIGDMGCFSFQASKNLTGGEGGMIVTNDKDWADRCWSVSNVGRLREGASVGAPGLANNFRLSEWPAAVMRGQLERLEEQTSRRADNAAYIAEGLDEIDGLSATRPDSRVTRNAYHLQKLCFEPNKFGGHTIREMQAAMLAEGVPITCGYGEPLAKQTMIALRTAFIRDKLSLPEAPAHEYPVCREVCRRGMWLRQSALLGTREQMDAILEAVAKARRNWGE